MGKSRKHAKEEIQYFQCSMPHQSELHSKLFNANTILCEPFPGFSGDGCAVHER